MCNLERGIQISTKITKELLNEFFTYRDGNLFYLPRDRKWFSTTNAWAVFNSRTQEKQASSKNTGKTRYSKVTLFSKTYPTHRLIWVFHYGNFPKEIDHIDGNTHNNVIENLRASDAKDNKLNQSLPVHNTSGYLGVTKHKTKWRASYMKDYKTISVGTFNCPTKAYLEVKKARLAAGFCQNHGER